MRATIVPNFSLIMPKSAMACPKARRSLAHWRVGARRIFQPSHVENIEGNLMPLADFSQNVLHGHSRIVEVQRSGGGPPNTHLVFFRPWGDSREIALHNKRRKLFTVDPGKHDVDVRDAAVGNPHLGAVQSVMLSIRIQCSPGFAMQRVRSGSGLAQTIGPHPFTACESGDVFLLLSFSAKKSDG